MRQNSVITSCWTGVALSLHTRRAGGTLVNRARRSVLSVSTAVILTCVVYAQWRVTSSHPKPRPDTLNTKRSIGDLHNIDRAALGSENEDDAEAPDEPDAVDLYGNEITDAVAKYKLDASGMLYELHSPDTEVPRLKPPKT
jgi:hypothetical protein